MKFPSVLCLCLALSACEGEPPARLSGGSKPTQPTTQGPFDDVDLHGLPVEQRETIEFASEDFKAVLAGLPPIHATVDVTAAVPADGGTSYYVGAGYKMTIAKSLSSFGLLDGYIYGPIVTFDDSFAPGNVSTVSNVRFYTDEQLNRLLTRRLGAAR